MRQLLRLLFFLLPFFTPTLIFGQSITIDDDFSDGDYTNSPSWTDSESKFIVNGSNQLQQDAPSSSDEAVISTSSTAAYGEWEALIELDFNPSGSNLARFYIIADTPNMKGDVNGYFVEIGDTDDEISLYRQDGNTTTKIVDGTDDLIDTDPVTVRVKVTRDLNGNWELLVDTSGSTSYTSQGTASDNNHTGSSYLGFFSDYTSTRSDKFFYDDVKVTKVNPPLDVTGATVINDQTIDLQFNLDIDGATVAPSDFSLDNGINNPDGATLPSSDVVRLTFNTALASDRYTVTVNTIDDIDGNTIGPNTTESFILYGAYEAGDIKINEFTYDPPGSPSEIQEEYVELINTSNKILNLANWELGDEGGTDPFSADPVVLEADSFLVISGDTSALPSGRAYYELSGMASLNNDTDAIQLLTDTGTQVDSLTYTSDWGGTDVALERRSTSTASTYQENWGNAPNTEGGTPGLPNEVTQDNTAPQLTSLNITSNQTLTVGFDERLESSTASDPSHYSISGVSINSATQTSADQVEIALSTALQNNTEYTFAVTGVEDVFGNSVTNTDSTFTYYEVSPSDSGDVAINEFMSAPPSGSSEYIEIYNHSSKSLDLANWTLSDSHDDQDKITDSQFIVPPDSFVVIAPDNSLQTTYPDIALVVMSEFPSLNNGGDKIQIRNNNGILLDSLTYGSDWGNDEIANERKAITTAATYRSNWGEAPNGFGTPGTANEINPDTTPPTLESFTVNSNSQLTLTFSDQLDKTTAENSSNYSLNGGPAISSVTYATSDSVFLQFGSSLQNTTKYTLTISGVEDIFGNPITNTDSTFTYYEASPSDSGDVAINEFMSAPPSGSSEYIELYNHSSKTLDIANWTLSDNRNNQDKITDSQFIVPPDSFVVIAPDNSLQTTYPDIAIVVMSEFPSLNNSGDKIQIRNSSGSLLDSLTYDSDWGSDEVAKERRSVDVAASYKSNWDDAPNSFGTPGTSNEINPDTTPPSLESFTVNSNSQLALTFSEELDANTAEDASNYSLDGNITVSNATYTNGDSLYLQLGSTLQNATDYTLTIEGASDIFGNSIVTTDTSFTFYEISSADSGDVFVNEINFIPTAGTTEYIELYNPTSQSFDLQHWVLSDNRGYKASITNSQAVIPPDSFAVIAPDNTLLTDYPGINLVVMADFPSLNNSGDNIVIHKTDGTLLDSLQYQSKWGGDEVPMERRSTSVSAIYKENWGNAPNGKGTPGAANTVAPDSDAPTLQKFAVIDKQTLLLHFSEQLKQSAATETGNYTLSGSPSVSSAEFAMPDSVFITLDSALQNATDYTLSASGITDIFDNPIGTTDTTFTYYEVSEVDSSDVFISEFSAVPASGSTEFVEIYNSTSRSFDLQHWTLTDSRQDPATITESQFIVPPDSFVVIAPDNTLLTGNPNISLIAMGSNFPSLNNGDDQIVLRNKSGVLLDSLAYNSHWNITEGSFERRTVAVPAYHQGNWEYSGNTDNSSPGITNTITQDDTPPVFTELNIKSNKKIVLEFNEPLTKASATKISNYNITGTAINTATAVAADRVMLTLKTALQNATDYTISISGSKDIFGNTLSQADSTFTYYEISPVTADDIFINEFSYNPAPGEAEFIEIINTSSNSFDLQQWTLNDNSGSPKPLTDASFVIPPDSFAVITPDHSLLTDYPDINLMVMADFPSLNNSGDDIVLHSGDGTTLDSLRFTSAWGGDEIALERRTTSVSGIYRENWGNAPTAPGSPGRANKIPDDQEAPSIKTLSATDASTLQLVFSERLKAATATDKNNYQVDPNKDIQLISTQEDTVSLILQQDLNSGSTYTVSVSGLADLFGNTISSASDQLEYLKIDNAHPGDLVINEILYNPGANQADFVELYNSSNKNFDLEEWLIGDASSETTISSHQTIKSGEYLVLTGDRNFAESSENIIHVSGFPSLNNSTPDAVFIKSNHGKTIDSLRYSQYWGGQEEGASLERKDPLAASNDASNWQTATNDQSNSAGQQNASFTNDEAPPEVIFSKVRSDGRYEVRFSEFIRLTKDLEFQAGGQPLKIAHFDSTNANIIILIPTQAKTTSSETAITVQNLTDVKGNAAPETEIAIAQPMNISEAGLVINEIMYNPLAKDDDNQPDQREYVELRNTRDYAISLEGLVLHDAPDENGDIRELQPVNSTAKWVPAQGTVLLYADPKPQFKKSDIAKFFDLTASNPQSILRFDRSSLSLASSGDALFLADSTGTTIDSVYYDESWQNPNVVDTRGIALERISPTSASNDEANWGSSIIPKGGTPNAENSIYQEKGTAPKESGISFTPNPFTPDGDGNNDKLFINYTLEQDDYLVKVNIYDRYGRLVRELADGLQAGFQGQLIWDGRKNDDGRNRIGIYIVVFEAYDSASGKDRAFKKTVVLARKLH